MQLAGVGAVQGLQLLLEQADAGVAGDVVLVAQYLSHFLLNP